MVISNRHVGVMTVLVKSFQLLFLFFIWDSREACSELGEFKKLSAGSLSLNEKLS